MPSFSLLRPSLPALTSASHQPDPARSQGSLRNAASQPLQHRASQGGLRDGAEGTEREPP